MWYLVVLVLLFAGCYNPDFTTAQGIDVFCKVDDQTECFSKEHMEHALEFFVTNAPLHGWERNISRDRVFWYRDKLSCATCDSGYAFGLAHPNGLGGNDLDLEKKTYIFQTALFRELLKPFFTGGFTKIDYESEEWRRISKLYNAYIPLELEFLGNQD